MSCSPPSRGLALRWTFASPNAPLLITIAGSGNTRTVTIATNHPGYYMIHIRLTASATDPATLTAPPSDSQVNEAWKYTGSDGSTTFTLQHSGTPKTFYLWAFLGLGRGVCSEAIPFI